MARVAAVLRALENEPKGLSLAQISAKVGLARSTVQRLVVALAKEGFVAPVGPHGRVRLGSALARLGAASRRDLRDELTPFLQDLAEALEETVDLAVLEHKSIRVIAQIHSPHPLRAVTSTGATLPLHSTATGKAFLAALPEAEAEELLPRTLPAFTPNTITSRAALWRDLEQAREAGVAISRDEQNVGISAVAGLVSDSEGIVAAMTIVAPTDRLEQNEARVITVLSSTCAEATSALGGPTTGGPEDLDSVPAGSVSPRIRS